MAVEQGAGGGGGAPLTTEEIKKVVNPPARYTPPAWRNRQTVGWDRAIASSPAKAAPTPMPEITRANIKIGQRASNTWASITEFFGGGERDEIVSQATSMPTPLSDFVTRPPPGVRPDLGQTATPTPTATPTATPTVGYQSLSDDDDNIMMTRPAPGVRPDLGVDEDNAASRVEQRTGGGPIYAPQIAAAANIPLDRVRQVIAGMPISELFRQQSRDARSLYHDVSSDIADKPFVTFAGQQYDDARDVRRTQAEIDAAQGGDLSKFIDAAFDPRNLLAVLNPAGAVSALQTLNVLQQETRKELRQQATGTGVEAALDAFDTIGSGASTILDVSARPIIAAGSEEETLGMTYAGAVEGLQTPEWYQFAAQRMYTKGLGGEVVDPMIAIMEQQRAGLEFTDNEMLATVNSARVQAQQDTGLPLETYANLAELKADREVYAQYDAVRSDAMTMARFNTPSGADAVHEFTQTALQNEASQTIYGQEAERLYELATSPLSPLSDDDKRAAALLAVEFGKKAEQIKDMNYYDIFLETVKPLQDLGAQILFDPFNVVEGALSVAKLGPKFRRIVNAQKASDSASAKTIKKASAEALDAEYWTAAVDDIGNMVADWAIMQETAPTHAKNPFTLAWGIATNQRTIEAKVQRAAEDANSVLNYLSLGVENPYDFANIVEMWIENPASLATPYKAIDKRIEGRVWDSSVLFDDRAERTRAALQNVATDILPLLDPRPDVDMSMMVRGIEDAASRGTARMLGGETDLASRIPVTATKARKVKDGDAFTVVVRNAQDEIIARLPEFKTGELADEAVSQVYKLATYAGSAVESNPVRNVGKAMRGIASQVFIKGSLPTIMGNIGSAATHSMWDNTFTLLGRQASEARLNKYTGAAEASRRIGTGVGGVAENAGMMSSGSKGNRVSAMGKLAEAVKVPQPVINSLQRYGDWAGEMFGGDVFLGDMPIGEEAHVLAQSANVVEGAAKSGWSRSKREVENNLRNIGLPDVAMNEVSRILADVPEIGIEDAIKNVMRYVDGGEATPITFADLGELTVTSLTPQARQKIGKLIGQGGDVVEDVVSAIREDMNFFERMLFEAPPDRARRTFTDVDLAQDVADMADDFVQTGKRGGIPRAAAQERANTIANRVMEATNSFRDLLVGQGGQQNAFKLAIDFARKLDGETVKTRAAVQKIFDDLEPTTNAQYLKFFDEKEKLWLAHADEIDRHANNVAGMFADVISGKPVNMDNGNWARALEFAEYNDEAVEAMRAGEAGAAMIGGKANPHYKAVIEANNMYTDFYAETMRSIFTRYPTAESFDLVLDADKNVRALGRMADSIVTNLREQAFKSTLTVDEFYTRRNQVWRELAELSALEYNVATRAIFDGASTMVAKTTGLVDSTMDAATIRERTADLDKLVDIESKNVLEQQFYPTFNRSGDLDEIRQSANELLGLPTATDGGAPFDTAIIQMANSDKVQDVAKAYGIEFVEDLPNVSRIDELGPDDRQALHRLIYSYAYETKEDLPDGLAYLRGIANDDYAQGRASNPFSRAQMQSFGLDAQEDVMAEYNRWTTARQQYPQGFDPTVGEMAEWRLDRLEEMIGAVRDKAQRNMDNAAKVSGDAGRDIAQAGTQAGADPARVAEAASEGAQRTASQMLGGGAEITNDQRNQLFRYMQTGLTDTFARVSQGALDAAKDVTSFTMINHAGNGRYWDDAMGLIAPFHFFFTRSGKNMLERTAFSPGKMSAWESTLGALERRDEQMGTADTRFRNSITWEMGGYRYGIRADPARYMPFAPRSFTNNWGDASRSMTSPERVATVAGRFGIGAYPMIAAAGRVSEQGLAGADVLGWTPQTWLAAQGLMASGFDGRMMDFVRNQSPEWAQSVTAKEAAYQGYEADEIRMVQEVSAKIHGAVNEYVDGFPQAEAEALFGQAEDGAWQDRLLAAVSGFLLPVKMQRQKLSEPEMQELLEQGRYQRYHPDGGDYGTATGSKLASDTFYDINPEIKALAQTSSIYGPQERDTSIDPNGSYFDNAKLEQGFDYTQPWVTQLRLYKQADEAEVYKTMGEELNVYITKAYEDGISDSDRQQGEWAIREKYLRGYEGSELDKLDMKYTVLDDFPYSDDFNPYPYLSPNEAVSKVINETAQQVQDDFPMPARPADGSPWYEWRKYGEERKVAEANQIKAMGLAMSDLSGLVAMTAENSPNNLGYPLEQDRLDNLISALDESGTPLNVTPEQIKRLAEEQKKHGERWPNIPETAGIFSVEGDAAKAAILTEQKSKITPLEAESYRDYLESKEDGSYSGSGGGGGGGGGGRSSGGGGGGYPSYAQRANIYIDSYQGLGSGLMVGAGGNDYQWQPGNGWRWFSEPERTALPRYRALGR